MGALHMEEEEVNEQVEQDDEQDEQEEVDEQNEQNERKRFSSSRSKRINGGWNEGTTTRTSLGPGTCGPRCGERHFEQREQSTDSDI
eukprot:9164453-Pyramimonas_sp.AAC.1